MFSASSLPAGILFNASEISFRYSTTGSCRNLGTPLTASSENSFAKDPEITPEEVVAKHLKSLGTPENLAAIKSRLVTGTASYAAQSPTTKNGLFQIASEGRKLGIATKINTLPYVRTNDGYSWAYDGHNATISSHPHPLRDFVRRYDGLLKEGLMGGTMSVAWPLLDVKERQPRLKYSKKKINGQQLHELTYNPNSRRGILGLRIRLYFHFETFRHVMTEYRYGSRYLYEQFDDFREVDGLTLPHKYTIFYSWTNYLREHEFVSCRWILKSEQWRHNTRIDPQLFQAD